MTEFLFLTRISAKCGRANLHRTRTISWILRSNSEMVHSTRSPKKMLQLLQLPSPLNNKNKLYEQRKPELGFVWEEKKIFGNLHLQNSQDWKLRWHLEKLMNSRSKVGKRDSEMITIAHGHQKDLFLHLSKRNHGDYLTRRKTTQIETCSTIDSANSNLLNMATLLHHQLDLEE